jgi:hypothetical protein
MPHRSTHPRRAAAVAAVLLGTSIFGSVALAGTTGQAAKTQPVTSGTWQAVASPTSVTFPASLSAPPAQYLSVNNTGSLPLTGATYTMTRSGLIVGTVNVDACVGGTWNESTGACTGGVITSVVTSLNTPKSDSATGTFPAAPGGSTRMRVTLSIANASPSTVTLAVSVTRSTQVRAGTTTDS